MRSSPTLSLFNQPQQTNQRSLAFVGSVFAHVAVVGMVIYGFLYDPKIRMRNPNDRYSIRSVDLNSPDPERVRTAGDDSMYPGPHIPEHINSQQTRQAAPSSSLKQLEKMMIAEKTLVQPDIPVKLLVKNIPMPSLVLWSASTPKVQLTPPPPHKPTTVNLRPAIIHPNREPAPSDLHISSTEFTSSKPMPVPGSTSPIVVKGPDPTPKVPETASTTSNQPASGAVLSLSDLHMAQGTAILPPANQTAAGNPDGAMLRGTAGNSSQPGNGDPSSKGNDAGVRNSQGAAGDPSGKNASQNGNNSGSQGHGPSGPSGQGNGQGKQPSFSRAGANQTGQFGVVVVGSSMDEEFPETEDVWNGRLVYSAYLKVGLTRNWILQYALPASDDATPSGNITHVEAPWPYSIVRPNVDPVEVSADALMIRGFVNEAGRFEDLEVAFPSGFAEAQYVIDSLRQWRFRPAKQNGQVTKVEILLIIPENGK